MNRRTAVGTVYIVITMVIWGSFGFLVRTLNAKGLGSFEMLELQSVFGALFTGITILMKDRRLFALRMRDLWCFLGIGVLNMMCNTICYFYGIRHASLAVFGAVAQTGPVFVILFGRLLFGEKITPHKALAMLLTVTGCALASGLSGELRMTGWGLLFSLGAGLSYSMYAVFSHYAIERGYSSETITFYSFVLCGAAGTPFTDWALIGRTAQSPSALSLMVVGVGLLNGCLAFVLYTKGLERVESGYAAILGSLELVVATAIGVLVFGEALNVMLVIGLVLVIGGIVVLGLGQKAGDAQSDGK